MVKHFFFLLVGLGLAAAPLQAQNPASCADAPGFDQMDFWLGEWTVVDAQGQQAGVNHIEKILGGCALLENWTGAGGSEGKSLFFYNAFTDQWKQVWVTQTATARGGLKEKTLIETFDDGGLRFQGAIPIEGGQRYLDRTTLTPLDDGRVRQLIEVSTDGGATWRATFDAFYVPRLPEAIARAYEPGPAHPYGRRHPDAPPEVEQFAFVLGPHDCTDRIYNQQDGTWKEVTKIWSGRYILDGHAIRDDAWRSDGTATTNLRQYDPETDTWTVTFLSDTSTAPSVWTGGKEGETMVVRQDGESPQGPFTARLMFFDITDDGYEWKMDILAGGQVLPWWTSSCKKRR